MPAPRRTRLYLLLCAGLASGLLQAETAAAADVAGVHVSSRLTVLPEPICERDGDLVTCNIFGVMGGFSVEGHYRPIQALSVGSELGWQRILGQQIQLVSSDGRRAWQQRGLWNALALIQYHPRAFFENSWLRVCGGLVATGDRFRSTAGGQPALDRHHWELGPTMGPRLGADWASSTGLSWGFALGAERMWLNDTSRKHASGLRTLALGTRDAFFISVRLGFLLRTPIDNPGPEP